jgi:hypothetical protein
MSGGNIDQDGDHIPGTSLKNDISQGFSIAYKQQNDPLSNVRITSTGGLRARESGEVIATSKQVYEYLTSKYKYDSSPLNFWLQSVARQRSIYGSFGESFRKSNENINYPIFLQNEEGNYFKIEDRAIDDMGKQRATAWIYDPDYDLFRRKLGSQMEPEDDYVSVLLSNEEKAKKYFSVLDDEDNFYRVLHAKENAFYAEKAEKETIARRTKSEEPSVAAQALGVVGAVLGVASANAALSDSQNAQALVPANTEPSILENVTAPVLGLASALTLGAAGAITASNESKTEQLRSEEREAAKENKIAQQKLNEVKTQNQNPIAQVVETVTKIVSPEPASDVPVTAQAPAAPLEILSQVTAPVQNVIKAVVAPVLTPLAPKQPIQRRELRAKAPVQVLMDEVFKRRMARRSPVPHVRVRHILHKHVKSRTPKRTPKRKSKSKSKSKSRQVKRNKKTPKRKSRSRSRSRSPRR